MEKEILDLLRKGVSIDEISLKYVKTAEASEVAEAIKAAKGVIEMEAISAKKEKEVEAAKKVDAMVEKAFEEKMKSIAIDPFGAMAPGKFIGQKRFSPLKKDLVTMNSGEAEAYKLFQQQTNAMLLKNFTQAQKYSDLIDEYNKKAAGDPIRSDNSSTGGYAIPTEVDSEIHQLTWSQSVMLGLCNTSNIIVEDKIYPVMYGTSSSYITNQATDITESQQTFSNPTVNMERFGTFSNVSNTIIRARADVVPALITAFATSRAQFIDTQAAIGNITGASNLIDGFVWDANTSRPTAFALTALTMSALKDIKNTLSYMANGKLAWVCNRKIADTIGLLENTAGNLLFPGYVNGGNIAPLGIPLVQNPLITSVLDVGGDNSTGGTDDVLLLADFSKVILGVDSNTRIESTNAYDFIGDNTTFKLVGRIGFKVIMATGTAGIVAVAQELTN